MAFRLGASSLATAFSAGMIRARERENESKSDLLLVNTLRCRDLRGRDRELGDSLSLSSTDSTDAYADAKEPVADVKVPAPTPALDVISVEGGSSSTVATAAVATAAGSGASSSSSQRRGATTTASAAAAASPAHHVWLAPFRLGDLSPPVFPGAAHAHSAAPSSSGTASQHSVPVLAPVSVYDALAPVAPQELELTAASLGSTATASAAECDAALDTLLAQPALLRRTLSSVSTVSAGSAVSSLTFDGSDIVASSAVDALFLATEAPAAAAAAATSAATSAYPNHSNLLRAAVASPALATLRDAVRDAVCDEVLVVETQRLTLLALQQQQLGAGGDGDDDESLSTAVASRSVSTLASHKHRHLECTPSPAPTAPTAPTAAQQQQLLLLAHWERLQDDYQCGICLDVLAAPKIADCTHAYCGICVTAYATSLRGRQLAVSGAGATAGLGQRGEGGALRVSATSESANQVPEVVVHCPTCRDVVSTVTFARLLDRDLTAKVDAVCELPAWAAAGEEERGQVQQLVAEWRERKSQYDSHELARRCSRQGLSDRARAARARAAVHDDYRRYSGTNGETLFLDEYYVGPTRLNDPDLDSSYSAQLFEVASGMFVPLTLAVLMLVLVARDAQSPSGGPPGRSRAL